jgi:hypothetical protein
MLIITAMDDFLTNDQWTELLSRIFLKYPELAEADLQYCEAGESDLLQMIEYEHSMKIHKTEPINPTAEFSPLHLGSNRHTMGKCRVRQ